MAQDVLFNVTYLTYYLFCRLDGKHVVFGTIVDGYNFIKKLENYGSPNGKTSGKIVIADCGQL